MLGCSRHESQEGTHESATPRRKWPPHVLADVIFDITRTSNSSSPYDWSPPSPPTEESKLLEDQLLARTSSWTIFTLADEYYWPRHSPEERLLTFILAHILNDRPAMLTSSMISLPIGGSFIELVDGELCLTYMGDEQLETTSFDKFKLPTDEIDRYPVGFVMFDWIQKRLIELRPFKTPRVRAEPITIHADSIKALTKKLEYTPEVLFTTRECVRYPKERSSY